MYFIFRCFSAVLFCLVLSLKKKQLSFHHLFTTACDCYTVIVIMICVTGSKSELLLQQPLSSGCGGIEKQTWTLAQSSQGQTDFRTNRGQGKEC